MRRVLCCQSEGAEAVGDDVRHHRQVLAGRCSQLEDAVHALEHIGGIPPGHGHVAHGVGTLFGGELRGSAQILGLRCQGRHLLGVGLGERLDSGHGLLEVCGDANTLHEGIRDLLQRHGDACGGQGIPNRRNTLGRLFSKTGRAVGCLVLLVFQLLDFGGQFGILLGQVARVNTGVLQPSAGVLQLLALPLQRRLGVLDALFQLDLLPLQPGGGASGFADFLLKKVVLLLQAFQLGAGGLDCALLFLVGGDVALNLM